MESGNFKVIESRVASYWVDEDGIIFYNMKSELIDSIEKAKEHFDIIKSLANHQKAYLMADVTALRPISAEAQNYFGQELPAMAHAIAIVSGNALGRMVANIFFLLKAPAVPMKFFSNQNDAKSWILQYHKEAEKNPA
jgi:hypothetical protein